MPEAGRDNDARELSAEEIDALLGRAEPAEADEAGGAQPTTVADVPEEAEVAASALPALEAQPAGAPLVPPEQLMRFLGDVPLEVTIELGRASLSIGELIALREGAVVELDKLAGEPVDILANGMLIARGEVVVVNEYFSVRITEIVSEEDAAEE